MKTTNKTRIKVLVYAFIAIMIMIVYLIPQQIHAQWNTNTSENILISNLITADMQQVSTSDGKIWIAFYHENSGNYDMRAQLIDADGYKLLGEDGILVDNKQSGSATYVFNVCVDADNNLIIAYQDERSGPLTAVAYKISQSGAKLWGNDGIVLGEGLAPYPAALSTGEVVIAWVESTLKLQKITTGGTAAWATPVSIMVGGSSTTRGQVIANSDGKFSVVYQKMGTGVYTTLYTQMFSNSGSALYSPLQISNQTTAAYRYYSVTAEADTTYCGYYASVGMRFNSFLQRVNPDGTIPWGMNGSNFNTATGTNDPYQMTTNISLAPGSAYVWSVCTFSNTNQTIYGIYMQKFLKSTGARQFTDLAKGIFPLSSNNYQHAGELALVDDTPMFMFYNTNYKIFATRLNEDGNFVWPGDKVELSSTTASPGNPKGRYCFTPDGPDRCAGSWTENRMAGYKGYAQGISVGGVIAVVVDTENGVPAVITTEGGTLQMVSTVYPASANQNVTWSIVPGTGMATISSTGLVTAVSNGTVYAKAASVQDPTVSDSLMITISGQTAGPPIVVTMDASDIGASSATLNGTVNANNLITDVSFEWGLTSMYGNIVVATPATVSGNSATPVLAALTGLEYNITYHFRVKGTNLAGTSYGEDLTFTTEAGVGINENDLKTQIFPNPNDGHFYISFRNTKVSTYNLDVYNIIGSRVYSGNFTCPNSTGTIEVDLGAVPDGIYFINLNSFDLQSTHKITVTR